MRPGWFCDKFRQIWVFGFHKIIPRWKINSIVFAPPCLGVQSWTCPISSNRQIPCDDGCWNSKLFLYRPRTSLMTQTDGGGSPARHLKCPNLVGFGPSLSSSLSQLVWGELSLEIVLSGQVSQVSGFISNYVCLVADVNLGDDCEDDTETSVDREEPTHLYDDNNMILTILVTSWISRLRWQWHLLLRCFDGSRINWELIIRRNY